MDWEMNMKVKRWALKTAMSCIAMSCVAASPVWGQTVDQPRSVAPKFKYSYYAQQGRTPAPTDATVDAMWSAHFGAANSTRTPAPTDATVDAIPEAPSVDTVIGSGTHEHDYHDHAHAAPIGDYSACDGGCGISWGCDDTYRLFPEVAGIQIDGWVAAGATYNGVKPPDKYNGVQSFNDRNEVQLNQLYLRMGKAIDTSCQCFDWGGQVDVMFGSDYIFTQATGLETRRDGTAKWNSREQYGLALPQMYAEFGMGRLSAKVGHFYTIIGNEAVTAPDNFFYSHAYTMQYGEPFTHTGVLMNYEVNDRVNLIGGIHNGWDNFDANTERAGFLGGFNWTSCDQTMSWSVAVTSGDELNDMAVYSNRTMISIVGSYQLSENNEYVIQHDNGWQSDFFSPGVDAEWYGINQYLFHTINDCWKAGFRMEWFRDDDGTRVSGVRPSNPNVGSFVGNFYQASAGLNWSPASNIVVRPEVRWEWFEGSGLPYDGLTKDEQFTGAVDAIFVF
jgi:hypothetical protein